ncbi:MAG: hypothetical protein IPI31_09565 [Bacteroidetes bacterium]|nr:hypothetical protein [Bacteroidota bacterium]
MEADILLDRQLITSARDVLVKAEKIANKYELDEELLLLKDLKQTKKRTISNSSKLPSTFQGQSASYR